MINDLRLALRQLAKSPGFTATALLTLALGIGACTAMFSVIHAVLLKPLPFREPGRLVWIENSGGGGLSSRTSRVGVFNGWREQATSFEALTAYFAFSEYAPQTLSGSGDPLQLRNVSVAPNFLSVLGVTPLHGRNFSPGEGANSATPFQPLGIASEVILSYSLWQSRFAGDPAIVGQTLTLNKNPSTVVGVLPRDFDFDAVFSPGSQVDVLTPFPLTPQTDRMGNTLFVVGRLKPGVTVPQAQAELDLVNERLPSLIGNLSGRFGAVAKPLDEAMRGKFRGTFYVLAGAVACVLAIACVNLSNLLLARLNIRRQEFAVRAALGARRWHLVRQAMTESLLLAFAGSVIGLPIAMWATAGLAGLETFGVPLLQDAEVNLVALAVTIGLTTLAGLACGLLPALQLSQAHHGQALQAASHQRSAGRSSTAARNTLVVAEVALACVLLVGAGLLFRSFNALLQVNLGFQPEQAMAWRIQPQRQFPNGAQVDAYFGEMVRRIEAIPGVQSAGLADSLPLGRNRTWGASVVGEQYAPGQAPSAFPRLISPTYLKTMQIPLVAGRGFDEAFNPQGEKVIVINQSLARQISPDRDPIGRKINVNGGSTIIGVAADVRHSSLEKSGGNEMYLDFRQSGDWSGQELVIRSTLPPAALAPAVRAVLASYDASLPNGDFYALESLVDNAVAPRRLMTRLLGVFSTLALTLAALGLYGVIAYSVVQRTQEIGIRMAIGAQPCDVLQLVLTGGLKLVAVGIALGLLGSLALARVLQNQMFEISAYDPATFAGIAALLFVVATLASVLPALRATKVDPLVALRAE